MAPHPDGSKARYVIAIWRMVPHTDGSICIGFLNLEQKPFMVVLVARLDALVYRLYGFFYYIGGFVTNAGAPF